MNKTNKTYTLYTLKASDEDDYRYIGITSRKIELRLREHIKSNSNTYKSNWIKKVLARNQNILITPHIENIKTLEDAYFLEEVLVRTLKIPKNLVNLTNGGAGILKKGEKPKNYKTNKNCRKVTQYTKDGNFVQSFDSIAEASRITKISTSVIFKLCSEPQRVGRGVYLFQYSEESFKNIKERDGIKKIKKCKIDCINKQTGEIITFDSIKSLAKELPLKNIWKYIHTKPNRKRNEHRIYKFIKHE